MSSPSAFERRGGPAGPSGPTGPTGPAGVPVVTLSGNTTGTMTVISSGTMTLAGGNNITLSQSGNKVTISGANVGGAQTGISGIVGSNATYTSGTVTLTGVGGGITVSSNTGQRIDLSVAAPVAQTNQAGSVYASSNTFGTSSGTYDARTISLAGSGIVSVAASNSGFVINASTAAQTNQAGSIYAASNTSGTSSGTYDARTLSIKGTGIITVAASNSGWILDATTAAQTNQAGSVYAISNTSGTSSGTYDARTLSIAGMGMVTVAASNSGFRINATQSVQAGSVYASSNTFGTSSGTYDARTISIAGSGGVSVAASNSGWVISAAVPIAQTNQAGSVYASSNTFGTSSGTYDARSISIAGSGGVSVAASNSGWVISAAAPVAQTNQAGSIYAASNTSGTSSGTYDARTLSIKGTGIITVAASNSGWIIDATTAAQTNQAQNVYAASNTFGTSSGTADARTLSIAGDGIISVAASNSGWRISATQSTQLGSVYASSNTFGTSSGTYNAKTLSIAGSGAVSVAASNSGWVISAPAQSVQTQNIMQVTASGNRTSGGGGYVVISTGTMALAGGPNITLSQDANTISISGGAGAGGGGVGAGVSTGGNTAGSTGTITTGNLILVGTGPISLSQSTGAAGSNATISINAPATSSLSGAGAITLSTNVSTISISVGPSSSISATGDLSLSANGSTISLGVARHTLGNWENIPNAAASLLTHASGWSKTPVYWHDNIGGDIRIKSAALKISMVTASQPLSVSVHLGVYTLVNSTSANLLGSVSEAYVVSSASSVSLSGVRNLVLTGIGTHAALSSLTEGGYMFGLMLSATATNAMNFSLMGANDGIGEFGGLYPGTNQMSTGTNQGIMQMYGRGSTTVNVMPAAVSSADLVMQGQGASQALHPWIYLKS